MYGRRVLGAFSLTNCLSVVSSSPPPSLGSVLRSLAWFVCFSDGPMSPVSDREEKLREIDSGCNIFPERGIQSSANQPLVQERGIGRFACPAAPSPANRFAREPTAAARRKISRGTLGRGNGGSEARTDGHASGTGDEPTCD